MITLKINGAKRRFDGDPEMPLLWYLRDVAGLTGSKFGCGAGYCGACTVHLDGVAIRSCVRPISAVGEGKVVTIEAMSEHPIGKRVQKAWLDHDVVQCGYCQAGQIMSAVALLTHTPQPT